MAEVSQTTEPWRSCRDEQCRSMRRCLALPLPCSAVSRSALRQAIDHICESETERRIAIALCELDGNNPDALWSENDKALRRAWEHYIPRAKEALKDV